MRHAIAAAVAMTLVAAGWVQAAPINLPADEAGHPDARTEWLYVCGHLSGAEGGRYGFMGAFFIVRPEATGPATPSTFAIIAFTDKERGTHEDTAVTMAGSQAWRNDRMDLRYNRDWIERVGDDPPRYGLHLEIPGPLAAKRAPKAALDLTLTSQSPALFINDGLIRFPSGRMTYYYSWPRLEVSGSLRLRGQEETAVAGTAWLEHQWGSFEAASDFAHYDYFALQLDDGTSLILLDLGEQGGRRRLGRVMWPDGRQEAVGFEIRALGKWTSPVTGITYPLDWTITIERPQMTLRVTPTPENQEISKPVTQRFWEGACAVTGTVAGKAVTGQGYAELVGYDLER